jgi:O-antigen/teichoic acid export membrane protein
MPDDGSKRYLGRQGRGSPVIRSVARTSEPAPDRLASRAHIHQRLRSNSGLIVATRVATACLSLATLPVVISRLGIANYGIWEALLAFATLSGLFQTAVSGTLVWRMSEAYGRGDHAEIGRLARVGAGIWLALLLALWPAAWFLREPIVRFLGVSPETVPLAAAMFPVVAAFTLLGGACETLEAIVSGSQRTGLVNVVGAAAQALNYSVVIALTLMGHGLWSLVAGQGVGVATRLAGAAAAARFSFGPFSLAPLAPTAVDWTHGRYAGFLMIGSVAAGLRGQTDKIVLASLASPQWVGYYGIAARLSGLVMEVIAFVYVPILTAVGALNAMGDWEGVRRMYTRLMSTISLLTGLIVVLVAGLADRLVVLWLGHPIPEVTLLLWLLMIGNTTAVILTGPGTAICRGCGRAGIETTYLAVNLVLNLGLTIALVMLIGPIGTAVATGVTWAVSSVLFLFVLHRRLDLPVAASRRAAETALLASALAVAVYFTSHLFALPGGRREALLSLLWWGTASGAVYVGLVASLGFVSLGEAYDSLRALVHRAG